MIAAPIDGPLVEFFQMVPNRRPPQRADRAAGGVIPARALRYCEAITSASAFGWYVFLPISFKVVWDGHDMLWTYDGVQEWLPLTRDAVQYPHFSEQFNEIAPARLRGFSPPFLTPSIQPGGLQVWTGCIAKSAPGWSLLVRGVANLFSGASYQCSNQASPNTSRRWPQDRNLVGVRSQYFYAVRVPGHKQEIFHA